MFHTWDAAGNAQPCHQLTSLNSRVAMQVTQVHHRRVPASPDRHSDNCALLCGAGLPLLQQELAQSAAQLNPLHMLDPECAQCDSEAQTRYSVASAGCLNPRQLLSQAEQTRVLGVLLQHMKSPHWRHMGQYQPLDPEACPLATKDVVAFEAQLLALVKVPETTTATPGCGPHSSSGRPGKLQRTTVPAGSSPPPYPLTADTTGTPLEGTMHHELKQSWDKHHTTPRATEVEFRAAPVVSEMHVSPRPR